MSTKKVLYIVHCIDTEGPLNETLDATFERLESIFDIKITPTMPLPAEVPPQICTAV